MSAVRSKTKDRSRQEELRDLRTAIKNLRAGLRKLEDGLQRENDDLREALAPFARFADRHDRPPNRLPDGCPVNVDPGGNSDLTLAGFRRARAAIAAGAPRVLAQGVAEGA